MWANMWRDPERSLTAALYLGVVAAGLLGISAIFLLTVGHDESWILLGLDEIRTPQDPAIAVAPVPSSGGLHAMGHLLIGYLAGNAIWIHRGFSSLCFLGSVLVLLAWGRRLSGSPRGAWLVPAALLSVPGTLALAASAYAAVPAFFCVLLAAELWSRPRPRCSRWLGAGFFAGLAAATRLNCIVLLPAFVMTVLLSHPRPRRDWVDGALAGLVGGAAFALCFWGLSSLAPPGAEVDLEQIAAASGTVGYLFDYPRLLNKWVIAESFASLTWLVISTTVGCCLARRSGRTGGDDRIVLLLVFAWTLWAAWLLRAPIPHLRYLWPSLAGFAVVFGLGLSGLYGWALEARRKNLRLVAQALALAALVAGTAGTFRNLVHGNADILSWEWARQTPADYFRRFQHVQDQWAAVRYLERSFGPDETVGVIGLDYSLRYLSQRRLIPLRDFARRDDWNPEQLPKRLVVGPMVGAFLFLSPAGHRWIEEDCELEAQFGRYSFYVVSGRYPEEFDVLSTRTNAYPRHPLSDRWFGR